VEPQLKYERMSNDLAMILSRDAASCLAVHSKVTHCFLFLCNYAWQSLLCFHCVPLAWCAVLMVFLSLRTNTEWISTKFVWGNHCHQQMNWLHFGRNYNRDKEAGYRYNRIQIYIKLVLPLSEWLHTCNSRGIIWLCVVFISLVVYMHNVDIKQSVQTLSYMS